MKAIHNQEASYIVWPNGFLIPDEAAKVHGITTERAKEEGIRIETIIGGFLNALSEAHTIVCHNYYFDSKVVGAELARMEDYGQDRSVLDNFLQMPHHCTMEESTEFCELPGYYNSYEYGYKWPKLQELYEILFGQSFNGAHNALQDIRATHKCFFELKKLNVIR